MPPKNKALPTASNGADPAALRLRSEPAFIIASAGGARGCDAARLRAEDIVGRWGLAAYHRDQDRARTIVAARDQCTQAFLIDRSPGGNILMLGHDNPQLQEMIVKVAAKARPISALVPIPASKIARWCHQRLEFNLRPAVWICGRGGGQRWFSVKFKPLVTGGKLRWQSADFEMGQSRGRGSLRQHGTGALWFPSVATACSNTMMRRSATARAPCATITEADWERAGSTGTMVTVIRGLIAREPKAGSISPSKSVLRFRRWWESIGDGLLSLQVPDRAGRAECGAAHPALAAMNARISSDISRSFSHCSLYKVARGM
jgi:hypothetical protein